MASSPRRPSVARGERGVSGWVRGMRFSGFTVIMMGLAVLAVIVIVPSVQAWVAQRQQIAGLQSTAAQQKATIKDLDDQRERWNDKTFITTQARERLAYVLPGEVSFLVINDVPALQDTGEPAPVSRDLQTTKTDWMHALFSSTLSAALTPETAPPVGATQ
ncbi:FtsB family cell division protein [Glaciibacter flavus]|uniref:FtsB family cell division protein n=1 Tax=Orlajensenia flava TaxID=2565934 RepID=UPI003B001CD4